MKINGKELEVSINRIFKSIDDYENVILNYYNELLHIETVWKDGHSLSFFESIKKTRDFINDMINSFRQFIEVLDFILKKYRNIGNKIDVNFEYDNQLVDKRVNILNELDQIYLKYQALILDNIPVNIKENVIDEQNKIQKIKDQLGSIFDDYKGTIKQIHEIELQVGNKMDKIYISIIKDEEYAKIVSFSSDIMMDTDEVEISISKLSMYKKEEDLTIEDIKENLDEIHLYYDSNNREKIEELIVSFKNNLDKIDEIHEKNILKIENHKNNYIESSKKIASAFDRIGSDNVE